MDDDASAMRDELRRLAAENERLRELLQCVVGGDTRPLGASAERALADVLTGRHVSSSSLGRPRTSVTPEPRELGGAALADIDDSASENFGIDAEESRSEDMDACVEHARVRAVKERKRVLHVCRTCGETFTHGRPFHRHLLVHGGDPASCRRCRKTFPNAATLWQHRCAGGARVPAHRCRFCDETFLSVKRLSAHVRATHEATPERRHVCTECGRGFVKRSTLYRHYELHEGATVCIRCGYRAVDVAALRTHARTHVSAARHTCEQCAATFSGEQQFRSHVLAHKRNACADCHESFSSQKDVERHRRREHGFVSERAPAHACSQCARVFDRPGLLRDHQSTHTGEVRHECDVCHLVVKTAKALTRHRQSKGHAARIGVTLQKQHLCSICGRTYLRAQALRRHLLSHSETERHEARHTRAHDTARSMSTPPLCAPEHACATCGCVLRSHASLRRHQRTHSDARPLHCEACGAKFRRLYNLRRHLRAMHGTEDAPPPTAGDV